MKSTAMKFCLLSEEWLENNPRERNKYRFGIVVGESRNGRCWRVRWAGTKTPTNYHKSFIHILPDDGGNKLKAGELYGFPVYIYRSHLIALFEK